MFDTSTAVAYNPVGDPLWAGVSPLATESVAATFTVSANAMNAEATYLEAF